MANSITTTIRRKLLTEITSGHINTFPPITHIAFGDGGVNSSGEPIPPSTTQTALNNEIGRYAISSLEYPVNTTARYSATIPKSDLIGAKISEAGLIDNSGGLQAIKTMYVKQKDDGITFTFTFDDEF